MIGKILCKLGFHKWKTSLEIWDHTKTNVFERCVPVTKCERCGEISDSTVRALMRL